VVTYQTKIGPRAGKVHWPETDILITEPFIHYFINMPDMAINMPDLAI